MNYQVIPGFPNYEISREGEVRNITTGNIKAIEINSNGYAQVKLWKHNKPHTRGIHRLLLITYVGPCPEGQVCRHIDGSRTNNSLDNLCYGTQAENIADKVIHGTMAKGETNGNSKLAESSVREIRKLRDLGYTYKKIAPIFDVSITTIKCICLRSTWAHVV